MPNSTFNWANTPPSFTVASTGKKAVFVKFESAIYSIKADVSKKLAIVTSTITFETQEGGYPLIDLSHSEAITSMKLRDLNVSGGSLQPVGYARVDSPDRITQYLMIDREVAGGGRYELEVTHRLRLGQGLDDGPPSLLHMAMGHAKHYRHKRTDRLFLERYLPANLEFDQHPVTLDVTLSGIDPHNPLVLFTNGAVEPELVDHRAPAQFQVEFEPWYSCSCPFFFLGYEKSTKFATFVAKPGATNIPITIFGDEKQEESFPDYEAQTKAALKLLHEKFGPLGFVELVLHAERHGVEYAAAAEVGGSNILHEMVHQYFGRGVLPADGNAGWIDEAIAHWVEIGCPSFDQPPGPRCDMGAVSPYRRVTDKRARTVGPLLLGYLDYLLKQIDPKRGMEEFLKQFVYKRRTDSITCRDFEEELELFANKNSPGGPKHFADVFARHVYGSD